MANPAANCIKTTSQKDAEVVRELIAIVTTLPAFALITVILRLYTRVFLIKSPAYEDLYISIAMILSIGHTISIMFAIHYGLGSHFDPLNRSSLPNYLRTIFSTIIIYNLGLCFIKVSILLQYIRITVSPILRKVIWAFIIFVIAYGIETFFLIVFECTPTAFFWDHTIPGGKCLTTHTASFINAGVNIATDFGILLMPIFIMKDSLMPKKQKYTVISVLSLGGAACIASIYRLYFLNQFVVSKDRNSTRNNTKLIEWSDIELNIGIICASVCTLRPLLLRFQKKPFKIGTSPSDSPIYSADATPVRYNPRRDTFDKEGLSVRDELEV